MRRLLCLACCLTLSMTAHAHASGSALPDQAALARVDPAEPVPAAPGSLSPDVPGADLAADAPLSRPAPAPHTIIATDPLATEIGQQILREGGAAIDAAIAVQMVLSLVAPQSPGIGSGAYLLHHDAISRMVTGWDGRETAPAAARQDLFLAADGTALRFYDAGLGGRAVGVPGTLRMLEAAHRVHGKLPWAQLFQPAIRLATEGFAVSPALAASIAAEAERLRRAPGMREYLLDSDGQPWPVGHRLTNPALAETLRAIAEGGADALYRGAMAADIAAHAHRDRNPGLLTRDDLAAYDAKRRAPLCAPYRTMSVCVMGPSDSGGIALLQTLGLLAGFDMAALEPGGADATHLIVEATRLALADRDRYLTDADFVPVPVPGLIDPAYLAGRAWDIDPLRTLARALPGDPPGREAALAPQAAEAEHTSQPLVIVDGAGNAVTMAITSADTFGAHVMAGGFVLNNALTDFSFLPEIGGMPVANAVSGGKRPRGAMPAAILRDGDGALAAALGATGGIRAIAHLAQAVVAIVDWRHDPAQLPALAVLGDEVTIADSPEASARAKALSALGHQVRVGTADTALPSLAVLPPPGPPRRDGLAVREQDPSPP